jgi:hypothetical protein
MADQQSPMELDAEKVPEVLPILPPPNQHNVGERMDLV